MWVRSLGREDPLEEGMATHSSILAWRIPWMEEPGRLSSTGSQRDGPEWSHLAHTCEGTSRVVRGAVWGCPWAAQGLPLDSHFSCRDSGLWSPVSPFIHLHLSLLGCKRRNLCSPYGPFSAFSSSAYILCSWVYLPLCVILFLGEQAPMTLALPCAFRAESEKADCSSLGPEPFIQKEGKAGCFFSPASLL